MNSERRRLAACFLDSINWVGHDKEKIAVCLDLADALIRLGERSAAEAWLDRILNNREVSLRQIDRARYLLRNSPKFKMRECANDTLRKSFVSGGMDANWLFVDLFGCEVGSPDVLWRGVLERGVSKYSECIVLINLAVFDELIGRQGDFFSADRIAKDEGFVELDSAILFRQAERLFLNGLIDESLEVAQRAQEGYERYGYVSYALEVEIFCELIKIDRGEDISGRLSSLVSRALACGVQSVIDDVALLGVEANLGRDARVAYGNILKLRGKFIEQGDIERLVSVDLLRILLDLKVGLPSNVDSALNCLGRVVATVDGLAYAPLQYRRLKFKIDKMIREVGLKDCVIEKGVPYDLRPVWMAQVSQLPKTLFGKDGMRLMLVDQGAYRLEINRNGEWVESTQWVPAFYIDEHAVTVSQYKLFCDRSGRSMPPSDGFGSNSVEDYPNSPVVNVSLEDARAYAQWVGRCLPSQHEWVAAAKGKRNGRFPWGDEDCVVFPPVEKARTSDLIKTHPLTIFDEDEFLSLLEGSLSLSISEKRRVLSSIVTLSQFQIDELIRVFSDERVEFEKFLPTEGAIIKDLERAARNNWAYVWAAPRAVCSVQGDSAESGARDMVGLIREWVEQPDSVNDGAPVAVGAAMGSKIDEITVSMGMKSVVGCDHTMKNDGGRPVFRDMNVGFRCIVPLTGEVPLPEEVAQVFGRWKPCV